MAGATRSKMSSADKIVDILNDSSASRNQHLGKRKREAPRRPGRPVKKAPSAEEEDAATAEGAYITPASTGVEGTEDISKGGAVKSTTKLRKPKDSTAGRQRESTIKMSHGTDVYTMPGSPKATSAANRPVQDGEFSLQHCAFHGVASSKVPEVDCTRSPSQGTRSKNQTTNSENRDPNQKEAAGLVRIMRKLPLRAPAADSVGDESLEAGIARMLPPRKNVTRSHNLLKSSPLAEKDTTTTSDNVGYPSPEKLLRMVPAAHYRAANKRTRKAPSKAAEREIEEDKEDKEGDREGRGDEEQEMEEKGREGEKAQEEEEEEDSQEEEEEHEGASLDQRGNRQPQDFNRRTAGSPERQSSDTITVTNNAQPKPLRRQSRFEKAAELDEKVAEHWMNMWNAAKDIRVMEDPETEPVRELLAAMRRYKGIIRNTSRESPEGDEDLLSDPNESNLGKIATAIGRLKKSDSQTGREENRLIRDIYLHAIPRAVELLRLILVVRALNGELNITALEELIMILKATRRLCERIYHWKPALHLGNKTKSKTNREIKPSLRHIEDKYIADLKDLRCAEDKAEAETRQEQFAEKQERSKETQKQEIFDRRRKFAEWMQGDMAERQRQKVTQLRHDTLGRHISEAHEAYDLDDLEVHESTPESDDDFMHRSTEEIQGPTKHVWRSEEKLALLVLLQKHRGPDRYEKIQEVISDISRFIRRYGPDNFIALGANTYVDLDLAGATDVLDDLGIMEVSDIRERAKYLKASQAETMAKDLKDGCGREKWSWLLSV